MAPPAKTEPDSDAAKLALWKDALYERVKESGRIDDPFSQDDLVELNVIPNGDKLLLMKVVQALSDDKLFVTMRDPTSGGVCWKWRDSQEAHK